MGRAGLTPDGLTLIGFGDHGRRGGARRRSSSGWSAGSSSSSAASSTCSTARSPGRPARPARSARSWTPSSIAGARRSSTSGSSSAAARSPAHARRRRSWRRPRMGAAFMVSYTRAKSEGLGFSAGTGMAAVGVMPREIRLVILLASASILAGRGRRTSRRLDIALAIIPSARSSPSSSGSSTSAVKPSPGHPPQPRHQ